MEPSRLLLVDDHVLFRESLGRLLEAEPAFRVVGQCSRGGEALELLSREGADLILLDLSLPDGWGTDFIPAARGAGFQGEILLVTGAIDAEASTRAIHCGVSGIFLKHNPAESLLRAIRVVLAGDIWIDPKVVEYLAERPAANAPRGMLAGLTQREEQVLESVLGGLTNKRIAERLEITEGAVKFTLQSLFEKSGVRSRAQLVRVALEKPDKGS
jgi:DNA-binding NarL/FixJ family response regulator